MKKFLIAGNWKMNTTISETSELINNIFNSIKNISDLNSYVDILVCPPFINIQKAVDTITQNNASSLISVGSQNCYYESKGAFTGEISIDMISKIGCKYIIIGHSERRAIFGESNELINKKLNAILEKKLTPILCIGETLEDRQSGNTFLVLQSQLDTCLQGITSDNITEIVVAYEPVWAIGTGVSATAKEVEETHHWIRNYLINKFGDITKNVPLLYGGSLNEKNALETLSIPNVNGGLIGGAALVSDKFVSIIQTALDIKKKSPEPICCCGCN
jgi:triosephosphate isomerase